MKSTFVAFPLLAVFMVAVLASCGGGGEFRSLGSQPPQACDASRQIAGSLVDSAVTSGARPFTGKALVVLERQASQSVEPLPPYTEPFYTPVAQTVPDASGNFVLCAPEAGTYLVAAVGFTTDGAVYGPTVVPGLSPGTKSLQIPLETYGFPGGSSARPTTISGQVATSPNAADVEVTVVDFVLDGSAHYGFVVPQLEQSSAILKSRTAAGSGCAASACSTYKAVVASQPALSPASITFHNESGTVTVPAWARSAVAPVFTVRARTSVATCSPFVRLVVTTADGAPLRAQPGATLTAETLSFTGCS